MAKQLARGLDLARTGPITAEEIQANKDFYNSTLGNPLRWSGFWYENGADTLRRYQRFVDVSTPGRYEGGARLVDGFGFLPYYAMHGFQFGVQYLLRIRNKLGMSKAQIMEGCDMAFLVCGPLGMDTIALALKDFDWVTPEKPAPYPEGWAPDPAAFKSGIDFTDPALTPGELRTLEEWYRHVIGEVPPYVRFFGRHRGTVLKAMRNRWENCFVTTPKQFMPVSMLHYSVTALSKDGIRENVLLAKAFGVTKERTINLMCSALINGWTHGTSLIEEAAGDVFDKWQD